MAFKRKILVIFVFGFFKLLSIFTHYSCCDLKMDNFKKVAELITESLRKINININVIIKSSEYFVLFQGTQKIWKVLEFKSSLREISEYIEKVKKLNIF